MKTSHKRAGELKDIYQVINNSIKYYCNYKAERLKTKIIVRLQKKYKLLKEVAK